MLAARAPTVEDPESLRSVEHAEPPGDADACVGAGSPPREDWPRVPVGAGDLRGRFFCQLSLFLR